MTATTGPALFEERLARLNKAIRLEPVDRAPVVFMAPAFAPLFTGMPLSKYVKDGDAALDANLEAADRLGDFDGFNAFPGWIVPYDLTAGWLSRVALPGDELPENTLWQVREAEVMTLDDYDVILEHGWPAFVEGFLPKVIDMEAFASAMPGYAPGLWVGGWRAASALISPKIWNEMVFPYYVQIVEAMHEKGLISVLHLDHDWTRDLARLLELPAKACVLNPDGMIDVRKAREILGDHMAIMGDVPATLFAAGTPDDIYAYVRNLVRDIGPIGLILCPGCDAPINTKPENMEAFVAAAHEFGVMRA